MKMSVHDISKRRWMLFALATVALSIGMLNMIGYEEFEAAPSPSTEATFKFELNGGTWDGPSSITGDAASDGGALRVGCTMPSQVPVKEGYNFAGWRFGDAWGNNSVLFQPGQETELDYFTGNYETVYDRFYAIWTIGKGTVEDPYKEYVEGNTITLDGKYIESGSSVFIATEHDTITVNYDEGRGLTLGFPYTGKLKTMQVLTGTVTGDGALVISSSGDHCTLNIISSSSETPTDPDPGTSYPDLKFLSDPSIDCTITYVNRS